MIERYQLFQLRSGTLYVVRLDEDNRVTWKQQVQSRDEGEKVIASMKRKRELN
jgi:hypothetical protein